LASCLLISGGLGGYKWRANLALPIRSKSA